VLASVEDPAKVLEVEAAAASMMCCIDVVIRRQSATPLTAWPPRQWGCVAYKWVVRVLETSGSDGWSRGAGTWITGCGVMSVVLGGVGLWYGVVA
jgi:hypothetical protein